MSLTRTALFSAALLATAGCDYSGDWLFPSPTELVPGVIDLGQVTPVAIGGPADMANATIYGEAGALDAGVGGVTFSFVGDGSDMCVFVDPEIAYWSQSVSASGSFQYSYPDNIYDDGDFDLFVGYSVYYNGSPGVEVGSFEVQYEDSLGNKLPIQFNECTILDRYNEIGGHSGRGRPEYCTVNNTNPGVQYTVLMETFSTPPDDSRLGYGLVLAQGDCNALVGTLGGTINDAECFIRGESIRPDHGHDYRDPLLVDGAKGGILTTGFDNVQSLNWPNTTVFEDTFCNAAAGDREGLPNFCVAEAEANDCNDGDRCFCGDPADTPTGGSK